MFGCKERHRYWESDFTMDWTQSQDYCEQTGGELARLLDMSEAQFVHSKHLEQGTFR